MHILSAHPNNLSHTEQGCRWRRRALPLCPLPKPGRTGERREHREQRDCLGWQQRLREREETRVMTLFLREILQIIRFLVCLQVTCTKNTASFICWRAQRFVSMCEQLGRNLNFQDKSFSA